MRLSTSNMLLAVNDKEKEEAMQLIEISSSEAFRQIEELRNRYLGPPTDVTEAGNNFIKYHTSLNSCIKLAFAGETDKVKEEISSNGNVGLLLTRLMDSIQDIDVFAEKKGNDLYANSAALAVLLNRQLILLVVAIILFTFLINYILLRKIRSPIEELTRAARKFHDGDKNSRSMYQSANELGVLSESFNTMVEDIQQNSDLDDKVAALSGLMLSEYDAKKFFQATLSSMAFTYRFTDGCHLSVERGQKIIPSF